MDVEDIEEIRPSFFLCLLSDGASRLAFEKIMNVASTPSSETVALLLLSLQRLCRNLADLLNHLDEDVDSFERLLTEVTSSMQRSASSLSISSSSATWEDEEMEEKLIEDNDDFYERLFDEQVEPRPMRVTAL